MAASTESQTKPTKLSPRELADAIRAAICGGAFLPGAQLHQAELAQRFGISRVPIREALQLLVAEGLARHTPNAGFVVTRLCQGELEQIYIIRRHLETEALSRIPSSDRSLVADLKSINRRMSEAMSLSAIADFQKLNRDFHFRTFQPSNLTFIVEELKRLWDISEPYRTIWAWDQTNRERVITEHGRIISAIESGDTAALIASMNAHRKGVGSELAPLLQRAASPFPDLMPQQSTARST